MATTPVRKHYSKTIKDFYKEYKKYKKSQGLKVSEILTYNQYRDIIRDVFKEISQSIIFDQRPFYMPHRLGTILITSFKTNLDPSKEWVIDKNLSKKYGKRILHTNHHTFGWCYKFKWVTNYVNFRNKAYYVFKAIKSKYATENNVGRGAFSKHIKEIADDPKSKSYLKF